MNVVRVMCVCARAQSSCARVHVRVFALARMCVVCSTALHSACMHRAVQVLVQGLCTRRVLRVHCARDARAWCECASARSRVPEGGNVCAGGLESARPMSLERRGFWFLLKTLKKTLTDLFGEDVDGDHEELEGRCGDYLRRLWCWPF